MRVAMYYNNRDVRLEEMPTPQIGPGELLVKVLASGICGSDVMEWYRIKKAPFVPGHEITGEIIEIGEGVECYKIGDRVFVSHHVPCNTCHYCLSGHHTACETLHTTNYFPGGFAEYIRVPKLNVDRGVFILPDEISLEEGTFIEPLACVVRGQRLAELKPDQSVLILGSGISGLLHLLLARSKGVRKIVSTDVNEYRLEMAERFGADEILHASENLPKADLVIVCTGVFSAFIQALQSADRGGTILFFAPTEPGVDLPVPVNPFWRNEMKLITSYGASPPDLAEAIELLRTHRVDVREMITHRLPLKETGTGFKLASEAKNSLKVIIHPHGN